MIARVATVGAASVHPEFDELRAGEAPAEADRPSGHPGGGVRHVGSVQVPRGSPASAVGFHSDHGQFRRRLRDRVRGPTGEVPCRDRCTGDEGRGPELLDVGTSTAGLHGQFDRMRRIRGIVGRELRRGETSSPHHRAGSLVGIWERVRLFQGRSGVERIAPSACGSWAGRLPDPGTANSGTSTTITDDGPEE
jgi:hypothetical protein